VHHIIPAPTRNSDETSEKSLRVEKEYLQIDGNQIFLRRAEVCLPSKCRIQAHKKKSYHRFAISVVDRLASWQALTGCHCMEEVNNRTYLMPEHPIHPKERSNRQNEHAIEREQEKLQPGANKASN
jgi:hypothetical protein